MKNNDMTFMFFNDDEAKVIEAMTSRIIPSDDISPGAKEAGAVLFIDKSLAGFFSHLQTFYRRGINELNQVSRNRFGCKFDLLSVEEQDDILSMIDGSDKDDNQMKLTLLEQFFQVVYEHTLEGTFGDPLYGGNRDKVGWKLIGFPGVQWGYTSEQMQLGYDASQIEILSLADLKRNKKEVKK